MTPPGASMLLPVSTVPWTVWAWSGAAKANAPQKSTQIARADVVRDVMRAASGSREITPNRGGKVNAITVKNEIGFGS